MLTAASFRPAIAAALAAAGLAALTGCSSFDYATDKPNVLANGGYGTSSNSPYGQLRVDGAVIVAEAPASGTGPATKGVFTANLTVAPQVNGATVSTETLSNLALTALAVDPTSAHKKAEDTVAATFAPVIVKVTGVQTAGTLNMADPQFGGVAVTGTFTPGDVIPLVLTLAKGQTVTLEVPVVKPCGVYQFAATKPAPITAASVVAYNNYVAGLSTLPAATEAPSVGTYQCAFPSVRDSQGAAAEASATAESKPTASATKH